LITLRYISSEIDCGESKWIELVQDITAAGIYEYGNEPSRSIRAGNFLYRCSCLGVIWLVNFAVVSWWVM